MLIPCPTRSGWLVLAATAAALGTAVMNVGLATALTASVFCAITITAWGCSLLAAIGFSVKRGNCEDGSCGEPVSIPVTVTNRLPWFRQPCILQEKLPFCTDPYFCLEIPALAPFEQIRLERKVRPHFRGHFHLSRIRVISGDPMGLFRTGWTFHLPTDIMILPHWVTLEQLPKGGDIVNSISREGRPLGHAGLGNDFFGVRPYREGDEMRYIHWRLSASKQHLLVRDFEASSFDRIVILLDTDKNSIGFDPYENNFEKLISLSASLIETSSRQYCHLTFITCFGKDEVIQLSSDAAGIRMQVLELLTELKPSRKKLMDLLKDVIEDLLPDSIFYLLSMSRPEGITDLLKLLGEQNIKLEWILADKTFFPPVTQEEPMYAVLPPASQRFPHAECPRLLTFQSRLEDFFNDETNG